MKFTSSRNNQWRVSAAEAIVQGIAPDGGLFIPVEFPRIQLSDLTGLSYEELAAFLLEKFLPEFDNIPEMVHKAYQNALPVSLTPMSEKNFCLELFHGKTAAFKDVALQLLPYLMTEAMRLTGETRKAVILTATSGDTGSAVMSGFSDVPNTEVIVFYPQKGISETQRLQMTTQIAANVHAIALDGNFDDAQALVKRLFSNESFRAEFAQKLFFTSANSINLGRLLPQIVYYFYSYLQLLEEQKIQTDEKISFSVPTGNFGDILAGYYAKQMGLPIDWLLCASNENDVLTQVINTGIYDRNRPFKITSSPSMDILVSSNFERLVSHLAGPAFTAASQASLSSTGCYGLPAEILKQLQSEFSAYSVSEKETLKGIRELKKVENYLLDPHSAVAYQALEKARQNQQIPKNQISIFLATASPYKFAATVESAIGEKLPTDGLPQSLQGLSENPVTQTFQCDKAAAANLIKEILK